MNMLPNYIRMHRMRHGLSQEEVAFLVAGLNETAVLRHERFRRTPSLPVGLAYAALFGVDPRELFSGLLGEVKAGMAIRAEELLEGLPPGRLNPKTRGKREFLESVMVATSVCER